jgi:hypothetical protein
MAPSIPKPRQDASWLQEGITVPTPMMRTLLSSASRYRNIVDSGKATPMVSHGMIERMRRKRKENQSGPLTLRQAVAGNAR